MTEDPIILKPPKVTRGGRTIRPSSKFSESVHSTIKSFTSKVCPSVQGKQEHLIQPFTAAYSEPHLLTMLCHHILSFVVTDPDTMTLKEAMTQPDREQFIEAMRKELNDHITRGH